MDRRMELDPNIDEDSFDRLHADPAAWRGVMVELAAAHAPGGRLEQALDGSVFVALSGDRVIKLYPPFMGGHFAIECAVLELLEGKLSVPTPRLLTTGERGAWPYLVMTRLAGESLVSAWSGYTEPERCGLLEALGALVAEVHALPVRTLRPLAPTWPVFLAGQRRGCRERQARTGLPTHLLSDLPRVLAAPDLPSPDVLLTGEYTPMNLFVEGSRLAAMYDFGDALVGAPEYDWLGPMCFLAAGHRERHAAFLAGYGGRLDRARLMRLLLLHRYSHLRAQLRMEGWQRARDFDELSMLIWP